MKIEKAKNKSMENKSKKVNVKCSHFELFVVVVVARIHFRILVKFQMECWIYGILHRPRKNGIDMHECSKKKLFDIKKMLFCVRPYTSYTQIQSGKRE